MAARRMREWSCDGSALARCPNRQSRLFAMTEVTGDDLFYASFYYHYHSPVDPYHSLSLMGRCLSPFHSPKPLNVVGHRSCTLASVTYLHQLLLINQPRRDGRLS